MLNARRASRGVTLIELVIGLALIALLLVMGAPSYRTWMQNTQIRTSAEAILNGLQLARAEALRRNKPVRFQLFDTLAGGCNPGSTGRNWVVSLQPAAGNCGADPSETADPRIIQKRAGSDGSANAAVNASAADGAGADSVVFGTIGRVANADAVARIDIDAAGGDRPLSVRIERGGEIRLCDPNLPATNPQGCQK